MESDLPVTFENTEIAFQYKTNKDLVRAYWIFSLIRLPLAVTIGTFLLRKSVQWKLPFRKIIKDTLFRHFLGGETLEEALQVAHTLEKYNVKVLLDYAVEAEKSETGYEIAKQKTIEILSLAAKDSAVEAVALKPTSIGNSTVMEKWQKYGNKLNPQDLEQLHAFKVRLNEICSHAFKLNQVISIDAEESWIQGTIDHYCEKMMERYNKERPIVHITLQMYRKDRLAYLKELYNKAKQKGFFLGVRLVRGAYLEKETKRAQKLGYESPLYPTKEDTDRAYNEAIDYCLRHYPEITVTIATHNEKSCYYAIEKMQEYQIDPKVPQVIFSQLYGMADHISFNLAKEGYQVVKYLPFGPLEAAVEYLVRRAQENSAIRGHGKRELEVLRHELRRRKKSRSS